MSAHTPGPWKAETSTDGMDSVIKTADEKYILADAAGYMDADRENFILMAAAPEMLDALKFLIGKPSKNEGEFRTMTLTYPLILEMRALIAKAEGLS